MEISKEFIGIIMECELLGRCGEKDGMEFDVEYVNSEAKAIKLIKGIKWENTCLESRGDFTEFLSRNHRDVFKKNWNVVVDEIKSKYMNEIREKIENKWVDEKSKQYVIDDVQFNVLTLFMLDYYSEYYQSDFYEKMLAIYLSGHLPCGWSGEYPEGRFIVY